MEIKKISEIIKMFEDSKLSKLELEIENTKIKMDKTIVQPEVVYKSEPIVKEVVTTPVTLEVNDNLHSITSPLVGTYYQAPSENAKSFVSVGQKINKGDVICIVEAMKVMNEIKADVSGEVVEILLNNGDLVEYNQAIIKVKI